MNQPYDFILISPRNGDAYKIREEIERNKLYRVQLIETAQEAMQRLNRGSINCVVFNFETFTTSKIPLIHSLRDIGFSSPVMVFATHIQKEALEAVRRLSLSVVIEKPFESKDVWGITQKLVQGKKVNQRVFRRYYTNQNATLEKTASGEMLNGHIFNLSRGGAYVEVHNGNFAAGDMLKMTVHLDKVSRAYNVDAQVVWSTTKGFWQGRPAVGLQFMKAGDVYRNLLDRL